MKIAPSALITLLFAMASPVWAAPRTVIVKVPGMNCPTCPVTIKKALLKDKGVENVAVRYDSKELVVSFDDERTTPDAIMKSTAAIGFPSQIVNRSR
ncbi:MULTISPECIES: mercury resistance system periplasmic binding protein MerP [Terriglobus]|jgi:mercuric ion binding protein|uniref:Periplasmic mercury ion-binding protein n=2 Tax=Terriglobus TaxID=392733 RepID=A0A1H4W6M4_9BACT|nr:mercury resistance system periplasmic binding protein MerP [Terriglobus roseus]SEC88893.1 mercuric ion binding protein [Terriglobus roseus]